MTPDELNELSCMLIAYAGEAYAHFNKAIDLASEGDFEASDREVSEGREAIATAHKSQISLLQAVATDGVSGMGVLAVHAQDHLMNAMSFENTAKRIVALYRRISAIESRG